MTAPLFHLPEVTGTTLRLEGAEGHHAADVRRVRVGERVDGTVESVGRRDVRVTVHRRVEEPSPQPRIVVVQALAKGERADQAIEAMTEVGVDEIVPWSAERSIARWRDDKPLERWRAKAREAAKQARRSWIPVVNEVATTADVVERLSRAAAALVAHELAHVPLSDVVLPPSGDVLVVIGPEGGIRDDELVDFEKSGASAYRLGPSILRTSTAGVVAAAVLLARTDRWRVVE